MTDWSGKQTPPYVPVHLDAIRIVLWETGEARKKMQEKPTEDARLLYALGKVPGSFGNGRASDAEHNLSWNGSAADTTHNPSGAASLSSGSQPDPAEWICAKTERGKPYFVHHPEVSFSLSDSEGLTAVAFAPEPEGLDIQLHRRHGIRRPEAEENGRLSRMARRFFHPDERDFVLTSATGIRQRFYRIWTAKEAYVKYTGQGIDGQFTKISVIPEPETAEMPPRETAAVPASETMAIPAQLSGQQYIGQFITWQACGCTFYYSEPEEGLSLCLSTKQKTSVTIDFTKWE